MCSDICLPTGNKLRCELSQGYTLQMKAPRSQQGNVDQESSGQIPDPAPLSTLTPKNVSKPSQPAPEAQASVQDAAGSRSKAGKGQSTLRWPQWEEVEPNMLRQQVPPSLFAATGETVRRRVCTSTYSLNKLVNV